jgi:D-glycero-D-manno-heptose 1,7-bisphosphate phosphatase
MMNSNGFSFTREWTLFLDRDGVISRRKPDDYVRNWEEFRFLDGVMEAMAVFNKVFGRIIMVSNQQGVGKGLMSAGTLKMIDSRMKEEIVKNGGRMDASYYSTHLASENHPDRKPNPGMALKAQKDFPEINFSKSVMVGDTPSDMEFGKRLGMKTVFVGEDYSSVDSGLIDFHYSNLLEFSKMI